MKILYISGRAFGIAGTQGTYLAVEQYAKNHAVVVVSKKIDMVKKELLAYPAKDRYHVIEVKEDESWENVCVNVLNDFSPDLICIGSWPRWPRIAKALRNENGSIPIVLEIKSPPLLEGDKLLNLQKSSEGAQDYIDGVIGLNRDILASWIPNMRCRFITHPLLVDVLNISQRVNVDFDERRKIVFVGSITKKRKLDQLLNLISKLPSELRNKLKFDFYGDGDALNELKNLSNDLGIDRLVQFKGFLAQDELMRQYKNYHIGLAWVPRDLYDIAPSLKLAEYLSAGIIPIATDTIGHREAKLQGFELFYFNENSLDSFSQALDKVCQLNVERTSKNSYQNRSTALKVHEYKAVVDCTILPFYKNLVKNAIFKIGFKRFVRNSFSEMVFISPRPLGLLATPGTYLSVEAYSKYFDLTLICERRRPSDIIVHSKRGNFRVIELQLNSYERRKELLAEIRRMSPEFIVVASCPYWWALVDDISEVCPTALISLEVKSPLLAEGQKARHIRSRCSSAGNKLSCVVAPSVKMAETWFDNSDISVNFHNSIIDYYAIKKNLGKESKIFKFVFAGTIAKKRKIDKLINYISQLPKQTLDVCRFDFFGDGPDLEGVKSLIKELNLQGRIILRGAVSQQQVYESYQYYDFGLAWVPSESYDTAPSLKLIEYCAAGLIPLATSNFGHQILSERGFNIRYFDEQSVTSFCKAINDAIRTPFDDGARATNIELAKEFDFQNVAFTQIIPLYAGLLNQNILRARLSCKWINDISKVYVEKQNGLSKELAGDFHKTEVLSHALRMISLIWEPDAKSGGSGDRGGVYF